MEDNILDPIEMFDDQPKVPLPNAQTAFILGILSIVPGCMCGCLGVILGIIGLVLSSNATKEYNANPGRYLESDLKNAQNGKTLSIVGIVITVITMIFSIIMNVGSALLDSSF